MKKIFELDETLVLHHKIEVETDDNLFDGFCDDVAEQLPSIDSTIENVKDYVLRQFKERFGTENVTFVEDGSPEAFYESL